MSISDRDPGSNIDFVALELLHASDTPIGNQTLVSALREEEIVIAEATAGRVLRKLVSQGLARTLGKKGRVLTPAGRMRLASMKSDRQRYQRSVRLVEASSIEDVQSLHDMLLVRRAIEPEAARLAALRATDEDIALLDKFTCAHCMASVDGGERVDPAISFHSQLLRASHHVLLIEIGLLVMEQTNTDLLDQISHDPSMKNRERAETERDAEALAADHQEITDAIRARNAEGAERSMRTHIDRLLTQTSAYMDVMNLKNDDAGPAKAKPGRRGTRAR